MRFIGIYFIYVLSQRISMCLHSKITIRSSEINPFSWLRYFKHGKHFLIPDSTHRYALEINAVRGCKKSENFNCFLLTKLSLGWIILTIDLRHIVLQFHLISKGGDRPYWDPEKRVMNSCSLHILLIVFKFYFFVCFCFPIRTQLALNFQLFLSLQNLLIPII